ncbi:hypothetical protein [Nannocystis pusilla]|uniref:hypothetical protein n=1 Tax=Nannocystis pusilla TaxID=889268 RepID=UPI003B7C43B8
MGVPSGARSIGASPLFIATASTTPSGCNASGMDFPGSPPHQAVQSASYVAPHWRQANEGRPSTHSVAPSPPPSTHSRPASSVWRSNFICSS